VDPLYVYFVYSERIGSNVVHINAQSFVGPLDPLYELSRVC
jgi:hypothetical protein